MDRKEVTTVLQAVDQNDKRSKIGIRTQVGAVRTSGFPYLVDSFVLVDFHRSYPVQQVGKHCPQHYCLNPRCYPSCSRCLCYCYYRHCRYCQSYLQNCYC